MKSHQQTEQDKVMAITLTMTTCHIRLHLASRPAILLAWLMIVATLLVKLVWGMDLWFLGT
jgi:hypothetical protein